MSRHELTAAEVADRVGGGVAGDGTVRITGVESLEAAAAHQLSFLGNPRYRGQVLPSQAGVVLVPEDFEAAPPAGRAWVVCRDPSAAFCAIVAHFAPPPPPVAPGRHPSAVIAADARVAESASIGACAVIEPGAEIGERTVIGAGCYIGHGATVGADGHLYPNVTVRERCRLGERVIVHSGTVIGSDGFGYVPGQDGHTKIPQVGIVQIDDDVELGALVAVDRARFGRTWIRRGAKIDNLVQIAHNVVVGEHCLIVAQVGIAGSSRLGRGVIAAGQVGIAGHLTVGDGATLMAQSGLSKDVPAGTAVMGTPAVEHRRYARNLYNVGRIDELAGRIKALEAEVADLKARGAGGPPSKPA